LNIIVNKESKPLGTCGPLSLLKDRLKGRFLVMNGDILTNIDFNKLFDHARNLNTDFVVVTKELIMPFAFGKIISENHFITGVEEKPNIKNEIIAGLYVMNKGVFKYIPQNKYFGMDNLIKVMLKHNISIGKYLMKELWLDIGQLPDYEKAQQIYEKHFKEE
jgi:NDP-sugar pyrophosphorylase family protein